MNFTTEEAAKYLGLQKQTLHNWRCKRTGPPYIKISKRAIRYSKADLDMYMQNMKVNPNA